MGVVLKEETYLFLIDNKRQLKVDRLRAEIGIRIMILLQEKYMNIKIHNVHLNIRKNYKKEGNSLFFIFDKIWPKLLYYSTGTVTQFLSNLKICKNTKKDGNPLISKVW